MTWDISQWSTWHGDRKKLAAAIEALGYKQVGWVNGKPNLLDDEIDWEKIEQMATNPDDLPEATDKFSAAAKIVKPRGKPKKGKPFRSPKE